MEFSIRMRGVVINLLTAYGNKCTLTKVSLGAYNTDTGKKPEFKELISSYSTSTKNADVVFALTNSVGHDLSGFGEDTLMLPFIEGYALDLTWLYNGDPINAIEEIESQNNVIAYIVDVGKK